MLLLFTPGGIDELFRTTAKGDDHNIAALLDKFGTRIVGPALFDNIHTKDLPRSPAGPRQPLVVNAEVIGATINEWLIGLGVGSSTKQADNIGISCDASRPQILHPNLISSVAKTGYKLARVCHKQPRSIVYNE
jgi:hypothetical protein